VEFADGDQQFASATGGVVSGTLALGDTVTLLASASYGEAMAHYYNDLSGFGDGGMDGYVFADRGLEPLLAQGGYLAGQWRFRPDWTLALVGGEITLENDRHPPVMRVGRYPLTAMVEYWTLPDGGIKQSVLATDSFFFKEPVESKVEGSLEATTNSEFSILKVLLQNRSESFKNIRMMLLLPPDLETEEFSGMMGFTLRGGEEKNFTVRVFRRENNGQDRFPVHLMIEYGEMLKHYSRQINGTIRFSPSWYSMEYRLHFTALAFMVLVLLGYYYRRYSQK